MLHQYMHVHTSGRPRGRQQSSQLRCAAGQERSNPAGRGAPRRQQRGSSLPGGPSCPPGKPSTQRVAFTSPLSEDPMVAIIGGGLSGLVCAGELARLGISSVVFDTGEHGVGGRLATRSTVDESLRDAPPGAVLAFDHAAQYFTATDPQFQAMVKRWEAEGVVRRWEGAVGTLQAGRFTELAPTAGPRFVATHGMRALAQHTAAQALAAKAADGTGLVEVRRPQWVSSAAHTPDGWRLTGRGRPQGVYDAVVIAHNGKCANRLSAPMGVPEVYGQLRRLKLSANWVVLLAFSQPVPTLAEGAYVEGSAVLAWAANNTAKLAPAAEGGSSRAARPLECWTLVSTQRYGAANKVAQESVPPEVARRVAGELLLEFEAALGLPAGALRPSLAYSRAQLWGAALPLNSPRVPCIWDPAGRAGVCGDWVAGGGSLQAAALSGAALAARIDATRGRPVGELADLAVGLTTPFKAIQGREMGQFPGEKEGEAGGPAASSSSRAMAAAGAKRGGRQQHQPRLAERLQPAGVLPPPARRATAPR